MFKIQIQKIKNTCIIVNSILYKPLKTENSVDYYEFPCNLNETLNFQIMHYSGNSNTEIYSVINYKGGNKYDSLIKEMKSLNIDLYYCQLNVNITVNKANSILVINTEKNKHKDIIGYSSYCELNIIQRKNVSIDILNIQFYPSKKIKYAVFFLEIFLQLSAFIAFDIAILIVGIYCIERWHNPGTYIGPYPFFLTVIPMSIVSLVLIILELNRVAQHTLKLHSNNK